ncbi:NACHT, LRR and PYD domains-containing protein 10 [Sciurus carolinensis]|uniref:NACHT, LRR and PYD domains-containing protein 10 n=1 Tax=Sciurus carolinensis TaxID=30640 RepID=A0AA41MVK7_SCICA|nr:NACHT, LRR and PYD domains-containing protein 10 [Sciurus carolinensis]
MASALAHNPREALLWALSDLEEDNFKRLKFHLRDVTLAEGQPLLARGELAGLSRVDLASLLILKCGEQEAVRVVLKGLKAMNLLELVDQLSPICLNDYREIYREHVRCLEERREGGINGSYNQLLLVATPSSGDPGLPPSPDLEQELDSVTVEALFDPGEKPNPAPSLVVLQGSTGTGKTTLARKIVLDWATGTLYPGQFDYVFYVSCREVVLLKGYKLEQLLFWCCGDNQAPIREILKQPERLLFILDGFDELQRPSEGQLGKRAGSSMEKVLRCLIRRQLLHTCSLLITTRPTALQSLEPMLGQRRHVHVLGFSEEERKQYFSFYFKDEEQARNAFEFVQGNDVLYTACQVPGICWMVCSWLKGQMERGQAISETPRNSTDIFTAYVSTFLPTHDSGDCSELTRHRILRGLCSLAAEGIEHQSSDYQEGLDIKKYYSFRHISFQEFFHGMSYLMKEGQSQLGEASCREVKRLVEAKDQKKNEEITLSMQFLLDILKKENFLNLELKFYLEVAPSIMQDLMHFKEQMESIKHNRPWEFEFSLYNTKIKNLSEAVQFSDISVSLSGSNERKLFPGKLFSVQTRLEKGQNKKQKCNLVGKGRGTEELDQEVRSSRMGIRKKGAIEMKGQKDCGMERQEDGEGQSKKDGEMRDQTKGYQKE